MPSYAAHLFDSRATPSIFSQFADSDVRLTYQMGDTEVRGIVGVIRSVDQTFAEEEFGDILKPQRCQAVICTDPTSPWGGVENPQLKAYITVTEPDGTETEWSIDPSEGAGIQNLTTSFALLHLVRHEGVVKAAPGTRSI